MNAGAAFISIKTDTRVLLRGLCGMDWQNEASTALCRRTWDTLSTAVLLMDSAGRVKWMNTAAESLMGRSLRALESTDFSRWLPESVAGLARCQEQGSSALLEGRLQTAGPDGRPCAVRVRVSMSALHALLPGFEALILVEIFPLEAVLKRDRERAAGEVMAANGQLLRNLAHEIKNPLGGIRGAAQLLAMDLTEPDDRECAHIIVTEADRLQSLVDRFLAPYRQARRLTSLDIHEVLEYVRGLIDLEFKHMQPVARDYDISAPPVTADRDRLTQIFLNLVRNAAQALERLPNEQAGQITLRTRIVRDALIGQARCRRALRVDVADNGPGIAPDMLEQVFYPLVTGRAEGTGLGLSLAQTFVRELGGALNVTSEPGHTVFSVILPLKTAGNE